GLWNGRFVVAQIEEQLRTAPVRDPEDRFGREVHRAGTGLHRTAADPEARGELRVRYTSTAPLSVHPMLDKTKVVSRMIDEYKRAGHRITPT
ncbi:hypothetical protein ACHAWF_004243, partial [Thalassiosira exigua]